MKYSLFILLCITLFFISPAEAVKPDGYIVIPSISLYKSVGFIPDSDLTPLSHFYDLSELNSGIAHLEHMMWDNVSGGRAVLVGHTPGGFSSLHNVSIGDTVILLMYDNTYEFEIFDIYITHQPDNTIFSVPPDEFEVVLITCVSENERLIVKAK